MDESAQIRALNDKGYVVELVNAKARAFHYKYFVYAHKNVNGEDRKRPILVDRNGNLLRLDRR